MKKLFVAAILSIAALALVACGGSGGGGSHDVYSMPDDGYYVETARYVNDVEVPAGSFEPQYVWVDGMTQTMHYKGYDHTSGTYHHNQEHFNNHINGHSNHHNGGGQGHDCYNITYDSYETVETDASGNTVRMVFSLTTQADYESVATTN